MTNIECLCGLAKRSMYCSRKGTEFGGKVGMIIAHIVVDGAPDAEGDKFWGQFTFVALPRPGERIEVAHDGFMERLLIESVQHRPMPHPLPEKQSQLRTEAQAFVYARWQKPR